MKCLLLLEALCLAVCICTGEEEQHWAKKLRQSARNPNVEQGQTDTPLGALLKNAKARNQLPYKKLEQRYPYNPLNYTDITTQEKIGKWIITLMALRTKNKGPDALWNKFKAQSKTNGEVQSQPFSAVVDLALEDVAKVIDDYQKSLKIACENLNSLTGQTNAPKDQKIAELTATTTKTQKCVKQQKDLLNLRYDNEDGLQMQANDVVLATLVHNATLIPRRYTDCAANSVMLAVLKRNEQCFDKFFEDTKKWAKRVDEISAANEAILNGLQRNSQTITAENVDTAYQTMVDFLKLPEVKDVHGGKLSDFIGQLHPKTGTPCGKDVIKSVTEAAAEMDVQHAAGCTDLMQQISRHLL